MTGHYVKNRDGHVVWCGSVGEEIRHLRERICALEAGRDRLIDLIAKATELLVGTTPGPWAAETDADGDCIGIKSGHAHHVRSDDGKECAVNCPGCDPRIVETDGGYYPPRARDALFIAASRELVPALVAETERLKALVTDIRKPAP